MRKFNYKEQTSLIYQYLTRYRKLAKFPYQNQEVNRAYQMKRVQELIKTAYFHTDFYKKKYDDAGIHPSDINTWEDFYQLPTVSKDEVIEFGLDMADRRCDVDDLILSRSSGSTGQFVDLYFDAQHFITQEVQVIRMLKEFYPKYGPLDKELLIYTSEYPFKSIGGFYSVDYINNLCSVNEIYNKIKQVRPVIVAFYPSILRELIETYGEECNKLGIKAIITNSEHSSQREREHFEMVMGCPVFDEYSSEEISGIAHQCVQKNYHMEQDSSIVEIMDVDEDVRLALGEQGEIVGTSLINFSMPLIRYRQGDIGTVSPESCTCGKTAPIFEKLSGRKNSSLKRPDGSLIPSGRVLDWTYGLVLTEDVDVVQFQITQYALDEIVVSILPGKNFDFEKDPTIIKDGFKYTFGENLNPFVKLVPQIEKTSSGKHIPIRSLLETKTQNI